MTETIESYLSSGPYDLTTEDGYIESINFLSPQKAQARIKIDTLLPTFVGFQIDHDQIFFNGKSVLAQLGVETRTKEIFLDKSCAFIDLELTAKGTLAQKMLELLCPGAYIGKLFADDDRRVVRDPYYIERMLGRYDLQGDPILSFGAHENANAIHLEKKEGVTLAHIPLLEGCVKYDESVLGLLPTIQRGLLRPGFSMRGLLKLHQRIEPNLPHIPTEDDILLVKTEPLHIRAVFGRVSESNLPNGVHHTSARILDPSTLASGDIYELYGSSEKLTSIPLKFYTLEPHREYVFFSDRDQLQTSLQNPKVLFDLFEKAPGKDEKASLFLNKGAQIESLKSSDWILRSGQKRPFHDVEQIEERSALIEDYIKKEACFPFLKAMEEGLITSEGVLFNRYLPSPLLKRMLLSRTSYHLIKRLYFETPSKDQKGFFSHADRSMLLDLAKFGLPVFWVDRISGNVLQYVAREKASMGMFVPEKDVETFMKATLFGVYGSNLLEGDFQEVLQGLLKGVLELKKSCPHPLVQAPFALITGGGPGAMEVGNRVAKELGILSCANIVDFSNHGKDSTINEQKQNPYIEAKMTYCLDKLVERQAEFNLDVPIFLPGGIGTDFEFALEEVRRKVGSHGCSPALLLGPEEHWEAKITPRFIENRTLGTTKGSEWVSNCFYSIKTAEEGVEILKRYFDGSLPIGQSGPIYPRGFASLKEVMNFS
jgi:predicted Rossmann-fold nucleotide-binding protein